MFHIYILHSPSKNKFYVGYTSDDLYQRLKKHNTNHKGFTGNVNDWVIVYTESFDEKSDVIKREKEIKNWKSAKRIKQLIEAI